MPHMQEKNLKLSGPRVLGQSPEPLQLERGSEADQRGGTTGIWGWET